MLRLFRPPLVYVTGLVLMEYTAFFLTARPRVALLGVQGQDVFYIPANMLGQTGFVLWLNTAALLLVFYIWKLAIIREYRDREAALLRYGYLTAVFVPYFWALATGDWTNPEATDAAIYLGSPIALLLVPTLTFAADLRYANGYTTGDRWLRSVAELVIVIPLWNFVWSYLRWGCLFLYRVPE
jgi:hypothetical protein